MADKKDRSIFRLLLFPLLAVLAGEIALMLAILFFGGVFDQLGKNMEDILQEQVKNRHSYLLHDMVHWSELDALTDEVNLCVQEHLDAGEATLDVLCRDSEVYTPLLNELSQLLIEAMYSKQVSGAFLVLAGEDAARGDQTSLPGLYFRDRDPQALPSQVLEDILCQRAPHGVVQTGQLSTDTDWKAMFSPEDSLEQAFFRPYYAAQSENAILNAAEYGYWTRTPYTLSGDNQAAISYSVPLILPDGTVYGVLGVELLEEYLVSLLPGRELHSSGLGTYALAVSPKNGTELEPVILSGGSAGDLAEEAISLEGETQAVTCTGEYYAQALPLTLYSRNAPFDGDTWYLMGAVPTDQLYDFVNRLSHLYLLASAATLLFGVLGILLVSYRLSRPIQQLSREVAQAQHTGQFPQLPNTRVAEIDRLVGAITQLSHEVLESSTRFLSIMDMASVELAGFEIKKDTGSVYVTDNYFHLLGMEADVVNLSPETFSRLRDTLIASLDHTVEEDGSILCAVPLEHDKVRYVRVEETQVENRSIGLLEDVTSLVMAKKKVETERDYDSLTGLLSRQGFRQETDRLFQHPEQLKTAALLTLDLDRLKGVNDKFGHSAGDAYIRTAGACFRANTPGNALCARISGDEFLILYYGYEDRSLIWQQIQELFRQIHRITFVLPDGTNHGISATGGVAWYPGDSKELAELMKFSDFSMYCVKKAERGHVGEFDPSAYAEMLRQNLCQQEFYQVLEQKLLHFHFQPIFDARTGEPFAYEALMRVDMPNLRSPLAVLDFARRSERLQDVETLTFFGASETFEGLMQQGVVPEQALLFLNSIPDSCMTDENILRHHERFGPLQKKIVIEVTETGNLNLDLVRKKQTAPGFSGMLALDDYGSGYNTELNLLELNPPFIKVDIAIVRNIHLDENKQQLMRNIVEYAHARGMRIIAEGLEYPEEVIQSLELGVDFLQGYFLAKPAAVPPAASEESRAVIRAFWADHPPKEGGTP